MESQADLSIPGGMHRCLQLSEIQAHIFQSLTPKDCDRLAQTCSAFYDQAMNVVWHKVSSFGPFIRCMPSDALVTQTEEPTGPITYCSEPRRKVTDFRRKLEPVDWQHFRKHAERVRVFVDTTDIAVHERITLRTKYQLAPNALKVISDFVCQQNAGSEDGCLFRGLTALFVHNVVSGCRLPAYLPYLCCHTLKSVTIGQGFPIMKEGIDDGYVSIHWLEIIPRLRLAWPNLRFIEFLDILALEPHMQQTGLYQRTMALWLESLSQLRTFKVHLPLHPLLMHALSKLPLLQSISFDGKYRRDNDILYTELLSLSSTCSPSLSSTCFPSLTELQIHDKASTPDTSLSLVQALRHSRTLTNIDISFCEITNTSPSSAKILSLFEAVSDLHLVMDLSISVPSQNGIPTSEHIPFTVSKKTLSMLFPLRYMCHFSLEGNFNVTIDDQDLRDVAEAWPYLIKFQLCYGNAHSSAVPPQVSLVGVQALYNGCPYLGEVWMDVNGSLPVVESLGKQVLDLPPPDNSSRMRYINFLALTFRLTNEEQHSGSDLKTRIMVMAVRYMLPLLSRFVCSGLPELTRVTILSNWQDCDPSTYWKRTSHMEPPTVRAVLNSLWAQANIVADDGDDSDDDQ